MTVLEVIRRSSEFLARKGVESPRLHVELLLEKTLAMPRLKLYLNHEMVLTESQLSELRDLVQRRAAREPLQHLTGSTSFCGFPIGVGPEVLVPRPETELLAERAWQFLAGPVPEGDGAWRVLDLGCGSGCLAIAIARHCPKAKMEAVDCSESALVRARSNAVTNNVADQVKFLTGDMLQAVPPGARYHLIVSNPPYIPSAEIDGLEPEVRDHDPRLALDGGPDGLDFYRRFAREAAPFLVPDGKMMLEFGDGQENDIQSILLGEGWRVDEVASDYSGRPRIIIACRDE